MLPDVGMVQMYSKSANVNDLGFAWTDWPSSLPGPALLLVPKVFARWFAMLFRDTLLHPYISALVLGANILHTLVSRLVIECKLHMSNGWYT